MAYLENNSTNKLLLANQSFVGICVQIPADFITAQVSFNMAGSDGTLEFLHSFNGIDFQTYGDTFHYEVGEHSRQVALKGQFFKIKYINGNSNQTNFHLYTRIGTTLNDDMNVNIDYRYDSITVVAGETGLNTRLLTIADEITIPSLDACITGNSVNVNITGGSLVIGSNTNIFASNGDILTATSGSLNTNITNLSSLTLSSITSSITIPALTSAKDSVNVSGNVGLVSGSSVSVSNQITGYATSALQTTGNNLLTDIKNKTINKTTDSIDITNQNINVNPIIENSNYDLLINGATLWADTTPVLNPFIADPNGREGWYYVNSNNILNKSNIYWYANPTAGSLHENDMTFSQLTNMYSIFTCDYVENGELTVPFLGVYSQPTGTNDFIPTFAHSRWVYQLNNTNLSKLRKGETILVYTGSTRPTVYNELPSYQLNLVSQNGSALGSEIIAYMTINTQGTTSQIGYLLQYVGYLNSAVGYNKQYGFQNSKNRVIQNNLYNLNDLNVNVDNFPSSFEVSNFPSVQGITGSVNVLSLPSIEISNFPSVQGITGSVNVLSLPSIEITNTSFEVSNFPSVQGITGSVNVLSLPSIEITNTSFEVSNFPSVQGITGSVHVLSLPSIEITNTSFEVSNFPSVQGITGSVNVLSLPSIEITNTSFEVSNFPSVQGITGSVNVLSLPSIEITNTSFEVSNFPSVQGITGSVNVLSLPSIEVSNFPSVQGITGSVSISNFPASQTINGTVTVNTISGFAVESGGNLASIKSNTDKFNFNGLNLKTQIMNSSLVVETGTTPLTVQTGTNPLEVNVVAGNLPADGKAYLYSGNGVTPITQTTISGKSGIDSNIINSSLNTHIFGKHSSGGGAGGFKEIKVDNDGEIICQSKTQSGSGVAITSTLNGAKQSLDVNVSNISAIPVSGTVSLSSGSVIKITDGVDSADVVTINTGMVGGQDKGLATVSAIYGAGYNDFGLQLSRPITMTNITEAVPNGKNALDTYDFRVDAKLTTVNTSIGTVNTSIGTVNTSIGTGNTLLTTANTTLSAISSKMVTQTNAGNTVGLNVYNIYPNRLIYRMAGSATSTISSQFLGPEANSFSGNDFDIGLNHLKSFNIYLTSAGFSTRLVDIDYIDSSGNRALTTITITPTDQQRLTNVVNINNMAWTSIATNINTKIRAIARTEVFRNQLSSFLSGAGVITVPNGYVGIVSNLYYYAAGSDDLIMVVRDKYNNQKTTRYMAAVQTIVGRYNYIGDINEPLIAGDSVYFLSSLANMGQRYVNAIVRLEAI